MYQVTCYNKKYPHSPDSFCWRADHEYEG